MDKWSFLHNLCILLGKLLLYVGKAALTVPGFVARGIVASGNVIAFLCRKIREWHQGRIRGNQDIVKKLYSYQAHKNQGNIFEANKIIDMLVVTYGKSRVNRHLRNLIGENEYVLETATDTSRGILESRNPGSAAGDTTSSP